MTMKPKASKFRVRRGEPKADAADGLIAPGDTSEAAPKRRPAGGPKPAPRGAAKPAVDPSLSAPAEKLAQSRGAAAPVQSGPVRQVRQTAQAQPVQDAEPMQLDDPLHPAAATPPNPAAAQAKMRSRAQAQAQARAAAQAEAQNRAAGTSPAQAGEVASSRQVAAETDIDAIRREGLTGRQLRMARRMAQKHGLAPTSDIDAVRLLRAKGIDPFQRANMLELVVPDANAQPGGANAAPGAGAQSLPQTVPLGKANLPAPVPQPENLPSTEVLSPAQRREQEISEIQRDIARRRQKKLMLLATRLAFFVVLPTFLAIWYFYKIATPLYATDSEFLIIQNEGAGAPGGLGGLLPTQFATNQDAIAVQAYLQSKDAMLRLDEDAGFKTHFTSDWIDPIQRLDTNPSNEAAYKLYKKNVKIGYDPTEGVIRMEVIAAEPNTSQTFSEALISYAEQRVNELSAQKREDQMRDARTALEKAEVDRRAAQENLVRIQLDAATLDPEGVIAALRGQITEIEALITQKQIELATLLNNARPNQAKVAGARSALEIFQNQLVDLNARMTDVSQGENSLAQLSVRIQLAQADLATRDLMLQSALQQMEQARTEANRQVRYLTVAVKPVAPEEAAYPRKFENSILAFLVFAGIYLMISLTASILREQVAS